MAGEWGLPWSTQDMGNRIICTETVGLVAVLPPWWFRGRHWDRRTGLLLMGLQIPMGSFCMGWLRQMLVLGFWRGKICREVLHRFLWELTCSAHLCIENITKKTHVVFAKYLLQFRG